MPDRPALADRLAFITATDGLKHIERANRTVDGSRQENVAEHTWHTTLLAMLFADAAPPEIDHNRVRDLLTTHDLVEIYAGDTVIWDNVSEADVAERESAAAQQLFALLPQNARQQFSALADEFARQESNEARFARAIDALHSMVMSWGVDAFGHPNLSLTPSRVLDRKRPMLESFPELWELAVSMVNIACEHGLIAADPIGLEGEP